MLGIFGGFMPLLIGFMVLVVLLAKFKPEVLAIFPSLKAGASK